MIAPGNEGIYGLTISNAIHLSSWLNRPIDLSEDFDDIFYENLQIKIKQENR
jgi:hypothetical protein